MGITKVEDWETFDPTVLKAKPFVEKFAIFLGLITSVNPSDEMVEWLIKDWLFDQAVVPYVAGGTWPTAGP